MTYNNNSLDSGAASTPRQGSCQQAPAAHTLEEAYLTHHFKVSRIGLGTTVACLGATVACSYSILCERKRCPLLLPPQIQPPACAIASCRLRPDMSCTKCMCVMKSNACAHRIEAKGAQLLLCYTRLTCQTYQLGEGHSFPEPDL